jgi:2-iminobutanoate/2-iminopropanoate deaminase
MKYKIFAISVLLLLALAFFFLDSLRAEEQGPSKKIFYLSDKPGDTPFSPAILIKDALFISGQLATNPETGQFEAGPMAQQAERVIKNIEILLKKAGMSLSDVVQTTAYIADFNEFGEFNTVFKKFFPENPPTRATVQVAKLARDAKIEISAIAVK